MNNHKQKIFIRVAKKEIYFVISNNHNYKQIKKGLENFVGMNYLFIKCYPTAQEQSEIDVAFDGFLNNLKVVKK